MPTSGCCCHTVDRPVSNENFKSSRPYQRFVAEATLDLPSRRSTDRVLSSPFLFGACGCHLEKWLPKILNKHHGYPVQHLSPKNPYFLSSLWLLSDASLCFLTEMSCLVFTSSQKVMDWETRVLATWVIVIKKKYLWETGHSINSKWQSIYLLLHSKRAYLQFSTQCFQMVQNFTHQKHACWLSCLQCFFSSIS